MGAADDFGAVDLGGPVAFGKLGACPVAFGKLGAGPVAFGKLGAGPVALGKLGAGPVAFGKLGAGPVDLGADLGGDLGGSAEGGGPAAFGWGDLGASAEGGDLGGAEAGGPGGDLGGWRPCRLRLVGGPLLLLQKRRLLAGHTGRLSTVLTQHASIFRLRGRQPNCGRVLLPSPSASIIRE